MTRSVSRSIVRRVVKAAGLTRATALAMAFALVLLISNSAAAFAITDTGVDLVTGIGALVTALALIYAAVLGGKFGFMLLSMGVRLVGGLITRKA